MDSSGKPIKRYERDPKTGSRIKDKKGRPIVLRKKKQPVKKSKRSKQDPTSETDYSVDSEGETKVDHKGRPIKRYVRDPETGKAKRDSKGDPII